MKKVFAVAPYSHGINFKMQVYDAWVKMGGKTMQSHYPWRPFHKFAYKYELPTLHKSKDIAQLRFVEPISINFDTFPDYTRYEIIPFIWDCWPKHFEKTCLWLKRHNVKTAIFTSSQTAEKMRARFPEMNLMWCAEGINTNKYNKGKELISREHNIMRLGGTSRNIIMRKHPEIFCKYCDFPTDGFIPQEEFNRLIQDSKIVYIFPQCDTNPALAGNIETLTQRYWECMLSRILMIGRAPKELISVLGYNPVIRFDEKEPLKQIEDILSNIDSYQNLIDKNRNSALTYSPWENRIIEITQWLQSCGYNL